MTALLFYGFAALTVVGALAMVMNRANVGVGALSFIGSMLSLGAIYVVLGATHIAVLQVLFYAGALAVMFVVAGTLLEPRSDRMRPARGRGASVMAIVIAVLAAVNFGALLTGWGTGGLPGPAVPPEGFGGHRSVGRLLFTDYVLAFEVSSLLLLSAVVGVVLLARRESD